MYLHGFSEIKLEGSGLSNKAATECYDLIRKHWCSRKSDGVTYFTKQTVAYSHKTNMFLNTESIFTESYLPKSQPVRVGILSRTPDKINFLIVQIKSLGNTIH